MNQLSYRMRFHTPAFLGNAEQNGQWRTPPIKALLRQWWRVAYAADQKQGVSIAAMRRAEGQLFGVAADGEGSSSKTRVRLRLSRWDEGRLQSWSGLDQQRVSHPEVRGGQPTMGAHLYLGYGPLRPLPNQTALKASAAIQEGEDAQLDLAILDGVESERLVRAISLMHRYGTLGGRSRNGWGSFSLMPSGPHTPAHHPTLDPSLTLSWRDALAHDWPQAIGADERGVLIWQTESLADWKAVMTRLAQIKIDMRTQFRFNSGKGASNPEARHWLSYPVTNHSVRDWGNNARLPNSLRFKVRPDPGGGLRGVLFHVPCRPPPVFQPQSAVISQVWQQVHRHLDEIARLQRIPA